MHVGFLDDGGERLLRRPPWLEEGREIAAAAQPGDFQIDLPDPGVPRPLPIAVALDQAFGIAHAMRGSGARLDFGVHQPPGGEGQHLADKVSIGALLDQLQKRHSVVGHRHLRFRGSSSQLEP